MTSSKVDVKQFLASMGRQAHEPISPSPPVNTHNNVPDARPSVNRQSQVLEAPETMALPTDSHFGPALRAFLARPTVPATGRYKMKVVKTGRVEEIKDWKDIPSKTMLSYGLYFTDDDTINTIGHEVFSKMKHEVTPKLVGKLMLLAYNLQELGNVRCFAEIHPDLEDLQAPCIDEMSEMIRRKGAGGTPITIRVDKTDPNRSQKTAIGYCYLAASYLRLYTKSAENYILIERQLKDRFPNFFGFELPFEHYHPDLGTVQAIKDILLETRLKGTFYKILYAGDECPYGTNVQEFLYRMHVSYTGLQCFVLMLKIMDARNWSNQTIVDALTTKKFEPELSSIENIFNNLMDTENEGYQLQMWKYARIFEPRFLMTLQTKNCQLFTATMAYLYKSADVENSGNVMNIAQISNMHESLRRLALLLAMRAFKTICGDRFDGKFAGVPMADILAALGTSF